LHLHNQLSGSHHPTPVNATLGLLLTLVSKNCFCAQGCKQYTPRSNQECKTCNLKLTLGKADQYRDRTNGEVSNHKEDSDFDLIEKYACLRCGTFTKAEQLWCCEAHYEKVCTICHSSDPDPVCCCGREAEHHPWVRGRLCVTPVTSASIRRRTTR